MICSQPGSKKNRGKRKRKRVRRQGYDRSAPPEEFLNAEAAEKVYVANKLEAAKPEQNTFDAIPLSHQEISDAKNRNVVSYSKASDDFALNTIPEPDQATVIKNQESVKYSQGSEALAHVAISHQLTSVEEAQTIEAKEEKSEVFLCHSPEATPTIVETEDYQVRNLSPEIDWEYRSLTPKRKTKVSRKKISVNVQILGKRRLLSIPTNTMDTVFELRFKIFEGTRILPTNQILSYKSRELPLQKQLFECGIEDHTYIELTDQGGDITEYIIEVTDAKTVRKLKSELKNLENALWEKKNLSAERLNQNEWIAASRLLEIAREIEVKKARKESELTLMHERHKKGFRQLHVKIMMLVSEQRRSASEYQKLKRDLMLATQKDEVLRVRDISEKLVVQFVRHDGCERELLLLESVVPDMVRAVAGTAKDESWNEQKTITKSPPSRDVYQYENVETYPGKRGRVKPRGQAADVDNRLYYPPHNTYRQPAYNGQTVPSMVRYSQPQAYAQYQQPYQPRLQYVSGAARNAGVYYR
jgi:hypothetical protein